MEQPIVVENFLSEGDFNTLSQTLAPDSSFPWFHHPQNRKSNALSNNQFTHMFYIPGEWTSESRELLKPALDLIDPFVIVRLKANLLLNTFDRHSGGYHTDCLRDDIAWSGVLYLDTCNGPTDFKDGPNIEAVANRFVKFPSYMEHMSWTATDASYRRVINFNWIPK